MRHRVAHRSWWECCPRVATFGFLLPGSGRSYDQDSGLTVGFFVGTHSIWDAFNKAYLLTNQVFFSFLDHLVYSATGSNSEVALRMLPITISAVAVGLLAGLLTKRLGVVAGFAGAAVLATNPLFAVEGSQVRGYSLVVLCTIVLTMLFLRALANDRMSTGARIAYAVVGAVGVATHLYMLVVLGILGVMSLTSRRQFERLVIPTLGALLGVAAYIRIATPMRLVIQASGRSFLPTFPRDLAVELLGGSVIATIVTLVVIAPVAWNARRSRVAQLGAVACVGAVTVVWLMAPSFLYPRFFLWLSPVVAVAVAVAVAKRPNALVLVLVLVLVGLQVHTAWTPLTTDVYPNREAGRVFDAVNTHGGIACAMGTYTAQRLVGYTTHFYIPGSPRVTKQCTVAFKVGPPSAQIQRDLARVFPYRKTLRAQSTGLLWSTVPITCWTSKARQSGCTPASGATSHP